MDKLIYKLIYEFSNKEINTLSNKFIKRLISKLKLINPIIQEKLKFHRYEIKQKSENNLFILEYYQGELK